MLHDRGLYDRGDEGGFAPSLAGNEEAVELILRPSSRPATAGRRRRHGPRPGDQRACTSDGRQVRTGGREAATSHRRNGRPLGRTGSASIRSSGSKTAWPRTTGTAGRCLTQRLGDKTQLVGDDLFVTNPSDSRAASRENARNAVLIKLNQIGTLTETLEAIETGAAAGWTAVVSHRPARPRTRLSRTSRRVGAGTCRSRPVRRSRSERVAKYNQLMRIEEELGAAAQYAGRPRCGPSCGPLDAERIRAGASPPGADHPAGDPGPRRSSGR